MLHEPLVSKVYPNRRGQITSNHPHSLRRRRFQALALFPRKKERISLLPISAEKASALTDTTHAPAKTIAPRFPNLLGRKPTDDLSLHASEQALLAEVMGLKQTLGFR